MVSQQVDSGGPVEAEPLEHRRDSRCEDKKQVRPGQGHPALLPSGLTHCQGLRVRRRLSAPRGLEPEAAQALLPEAAPEALT